jgi:dihydroorotate dehydrogenase
MVRMSLYGMLWPLIRLLPPEMAHALALRVLALPLRFGPCIDDPFEWNGLRCRNRVGIAAGFDKNGLAVAGAERMGAGFLEVGTILVEPWPGNQVFPRVRRLVRQHAIWNRLGFTSQGLSRVVSRLQRATSASRRGMALLCNIGPHPGRFRPTDHPLATVRDELLQLVDRLFPIADAFVVNFSSPNTRGLRSLLQSDELGPQVLRPIIDRLREHGHATGRHRQTPLLVKLPPEDHDRQPWSRETLRRLICPLLDAQFCDGFVAVNTSTRLALQMVHLPPHDLPGGISGAPLRPEAIRVVSHIRELTGPRALLIGCGGILHVADAIEFLHAGADLVEIYTGMVYRGPRLLSDCAAAIRDQIRASADQLGAGRDPSSGE